MSVTVTGLSGEHGLVVQWMFFRATLISVCHQYVIDTKYTYKCASCGYSIGRHTKSIDTDRKRCGYCRDVLKF
ncbi:unnamed protein product [Tenebrio molitor]|nr:unnamed protein product [Tenebrio molitor]